MHGSKEAGKTDSFNWSSTSLTLTEIRTIRLNATEIKTDE